MGRRKPGKPRRPRDRHIPRQLTLHDLQPPGAAYEEWYCVEPGMDPTRINDPRVNDEALEMMHRLARLAPLYGRNIPQAALYLDTLIDTGNLAVLHGEEDVTVIPIAEVAAIQKGQTEDDIRESVHRLHAFGAFLVVPDEEHDIPLIKFVAKRPDKPGESWAFIGDPHVAAATTCVPSGLWQELDGDVAAAVTFMRSCRSRLEEPDPAVYGTHEGVNGSEHARELFAAALASGYVDYKGCEACPAGPAPYR